MNKVSRLRYVKVIALLVVAVVSVFSLVLVLGKGVNAQNASTGQTWIHNFESTPMTCEKICSSKGSKLLIDGCYARDTKKNPKLCTMSSATNCIDYDSSKLITKDYSTACCCEGTNFKRCTSTDGDNPFVKGTTNDGQGTKVTDKCNGNEIIDYKCNASGDVQNMNGYICPNGCNDGACVKAPVEEPTPECTDSDNGKDYSVKGETADFGNTRKDSCFDSNTVTEFYCEQAEGQTRPSRAAEQKICEYGCNDGACVAEPNEEDLDRIENQKKIQELITGAKGMTGMLNSINVMQRAFIQLAGQGVAMPEELAQTIARVKELGPEMNDFKNRNAENVTDEEAATLTDNASELCEIGPTLQEWGDQIPSFLQLGAKMKQMTKDLKKAKSDVKLAVKAAARSKFGISDKVDELNGAVDALKTTMDDASASTDFDEKDGKFNEFYDQFQDIYDTIGVINALQNTAKAKVEWGKRVKTNARTVSQLTSAGSDVAELATKSDEVKARVAELSSALAKKPIDRDEVKWIFEDLKTLQSGFVDIVDQLRGVKSALPKVQTVKFNTSQFKNFGAFSQFCGVPQQEDNGEEVPDSEK